MVENLKNLRVKTKTKPEDLAQILNVSKRTYQNYESGFTQMDFKSIMKIADYFGCSIDYLLGHQTKNVLYLDSFTPLQREIIEYIKKLDDDQLNVLKGMFGTVVGVPLEELLKKEGE